MCHDRFAVPCDEGEFGAVQGLIWHYEPLDVFRVEPIIGKTQEKALIEAIEFVPDNRVSQGK